MSAKNFLPLVTFCNGKGPSRSSRAAQERYSRRGRRALTATAPLSDRRFCGFFSVKADLMGTLYHRGGKMSREEAVWDASFLLVRSAPNECLKSKDFAKYVMEWICTFWVQAGVCLNKQDTMINRWKRNPNFRIFLFGVKAYKKMCFSLRVIASVIAVKKWSEKWSRGQGGDQRFFLLWITEMKSWAVTVNSDSRFVGGDVPSKGCGRKVCCNQNQKNKRGTSPTSGKSAVFGNKKLNGQDEW